MTRRNRRYQPEAVSPLEGRRVPSAAPLFAAPVGGFQGIFAAYHAYEQHNNAVAARTGRFRPASAFGPALAAEGVRAFPGTGFVSAPAGFAYQVPAPGAGVNVGHNGGFGPGFGFGGGPNFGGRGGGLFGNHGVGSGGGRR